MTCRTCGATNPDGAATCRVCGLNPTAAPVALTERPGDRAAAPQVLITPTERQPTEPSDEPHIAISAANALGAGIITWLAAPIIGVAVGAFGNPVIGAVIGAGTALIAAIIAVAFGHYALRVIARGEVVGRPIAITGLVLGYAMVGVLALAGIAACVFFGVGLAVQGGGLR